MSGQMYGHVGMEFEDLEQVEVRQVADAINPSHYQTGSIECIEAIEAALTPEEYRGYLKGQIFRYNWRLGHKDEPVQEAGKLHWYADRLHKWLVKAGK